MASRAPAWRRARCSSAPPWKVCRWNCQRQYVQQGRYDANIETEVIPEPRNRVAISIDVDEGNVSTIKHVNVVGNHRLR